MFNTRPIGKWHLQVCTTTPCWLRGSDDVTAVCRQFTGINGWGETSADGLFTMTEVECLGACVDAPILQVNDDFYEDMDAERTARLLEALKRGEPPRPGSMAGRQTSAPEGGPVTLTTLQNLGPPARLLEALKRGEPPRPGSMAGRQTSAPEGGPVTLTTLQNLGPPAREA